MNWIRILVVAALYGASIIEAATGQVSESSQLTDAAILEYARSTYNKREMMNQKIVLGIHNQVKVIAEFPCSDLCPDYTTRLIRYDVPLDQCGQVNGVPRQVMVPRGIAIDRETYCFPKVLVKNWKQYRR
jgi:hypothetical protein